MILNPYKIILGPYLTEKTMRASMFAQHAFKVSTKATKPEIKSAVEKIFNVKIKKVATVNILGKKKTFKNVPGMQSNWKKAIVTLDKGSEINLDNFK